MRVSRVLLNASLASLVMLSPLASRGVAHAQSVPGKEHARRLFEEGVDLEKKGDYAAALARYREAEQITATPGLRFHKGYCLEMTGKLTAAVDEYESADKMAREQNKSEVHAAVVARLDPLRARVPQIAIRLATPAKDSEVQLDGVAVGAPLLEGKAFRLDPGEHAVTARAPGYRNFARKVLVPESITTTVDITLERTAATQAVAAAPPPGPANAGETQPAASTTEPPNEAAPRRSFTLPIVATGGAVVLAATGVAFFVVAGGAQGDAKTQCPLKTTCSSEQSRVRTFDALALGSFIGAAGLGVLSVVLWTSKGTSTSGEVRRGTRVVAMPGAAAVEGSF